MENNDIKSEIPHNNSCACNGCRTEVAGHTRSMAHIKTAIIELEKAINIGGEEDAAILEHYGDALFKNNQVEKAVEAWKKANNIESSEILQKKIKTKSIL